MYHSPRQNETPTGKRSVVLNGPLLVQVIIVGVVLGWATGLNKSEDVDSAADLVKW